MTDLLDQHRKLNGLDRPGARTRILSARFTHGEYSELEKFAWTKGVTLSDWVHQTRASIRVLRPDGPSSSFNRQECARHTSMKLCGRRIRRSNLPWNFSRRVISLPLLIHSTSEEEFRKSPMPEIACARSHEAMSILPNAL